MERATYIDAIRLAEVRSARHAADVAKERALRLEAEAQVLLLKAAIAYKLGDGDSFDLDTGAITWRDDER